MAHRKSPLFSTAASLIALSTLTGCATMDNPFSSSRQPMTAEQFNASNYQEAMKRAAEARDSGDFKDAETSFMRAAEYEPHNTEPLIGLADVLWQQHKAAESAKVLEHALQIDDHNDVALRNLGRAYVGLNEPAKAQHAYLAALAIDPNSARTLNGLGISYDMAGDHDTAVKHYRAGLSLEPNNMDLKNNLAYSLITDKKYEEAIAILEPLVKEPGATARQRSNLALAYGLAGRPDDARLTLAQDLAPAQVARNLDTYQRMRGEPTQSTALTGVGRPSFERGSLATTEPEPQPQMAPPPADVAAADLPPPAPSELVGVPDGSVLVKPEPEQPKPVPVAAAPRPEPARPTPVPRAVEPAPAPVVPAHPQPMDLAATAVPASPAPAPVQQAASLPSPGTINSGLGSAKIYLGSFADEAAARESWIRVWTANSTTLSSLVASIEPNNGQMALYAVGASSNASATGICTKLRQNGVSCGVSN